jgi:hypothetical protein
MRKIKQSLITIMARKHLEEIFSDTTSSQKRCVGGPLYFKKFQENVASSRERLDKKSAEDSLQSRYSGHQPIGGQGPKGRPAALQSDGL